MIEEIDSEIKLGGSLDHKRLEQFRGFLVYVTRTYPAMVPFLKGIHLTLDSWRPHRDDEGWRWTAKEIKLQMDGEDWDELMSGENQGPPKRVQAVPRLSDDIQSLRDLMSEEKPPLRLVRSSVIGVAFYGFGDASGSGFGSMVEGRTGLRYRHGLWGKDVEGKSSNYRELRNLVESIEEGIEDGSLVGAEVFIFTDNTVAEAAFYKGNSPSRDLFNLIVRLRKIEMSGSTKLWVVHVSGKRMISQGTDGLSRGNLVEGVMSGEPMMSYIPLAESALERSGNAVLTWCQEWSEHTQLKALKPEEWFVEGHGVIGGKPDTTGVWIPDSRESGLFLWSPAPAAAGVAIEELGLSRHKRTGLGHIFVCPRLMTHLWRKRLFKLADIVFEVPAGCRPFWPSALFEPLIVGILLPFAPHPPWQLRRSERVLELEGQLRDVWKDPVRDERPVLRELWELARPVVSM